MRRLLLISRFFALGLLLLLPVANTAAEAPAEGRHGMVVSTHHLAARAGHSMLEKGGNAIDAAVATAFAVGVTQPFSAGIGGGAFMTIRMGSGEAVALDARETAPAAADRDMYVRRGVPEKASLFGPLAVATPGFVAGMAQALERYGTLDLATVMAPAIALAREGFEIGPYHVGMLERMQQYGLPERFPETGRVQFPPKGTPIEVGWRLVQRDLARTLERIATDGPQVFYTGAIARAIADDMQKSGGLVTLDDLAGYEPRFRKVVRGTYRGLEVLSFPPPSSGGIALIESLNILEGFDLRGYSASSAGAVHRIAEAMKLAFADRAAYLGDADFVDVPTARLVSKLYAGNLRKKINPPWWRRAPWKWGRSENAMRLRGPGLEQNDEGTTHLSTSDALGNVVALTMTINTPFGSGLTVPGTGIVLNNEMDDFSVAPDTPNAYGLVDTRGNNAVGPRKRPLSSMTPTVVVREGRPFMVSGSPGGPRIISTTLLTLVNVIDFDMNVQQAVAAPRFHHQWVPNKLFVEPAFDAEAIKGLRARGHDVEVGSRPWSAAEAIVLDWERGVHLGGADPRTDGLAVGFTQPGR
ncbi:MAG: gamma-glutamyltransferase [Planctomycetota bacterium]|jgi:gamma-glutamyltranspeptidase/glutathione hydrolase